MKVIVVEIKKDVLKKCLQVFNITEQITFLDGLKVTDEDAKYGKSFNYEPYYIEENIADLDKVITLYNDDINYTRKIFECGEMGGFYELLRNIKKQRDIGYRVDDVEYIFQMGKRLDLPIEYHHVSELDGRVDSADYYVITGQSDLGKMELFHRFAYDFTLVFSRNKTKKFSEMEYNEFTIWHPYTYTGALNDMIAIMTNDKEYFKNKGFSIFDD